MKRMSQKVYSRHIYRLKWITRYSNRLRVCDEDVAQHSFFVAALILQLHDRYVFNLGYALQAAICHDILEADLSDVTHDIKARHPDLKKEILIAEQKEVIKYPAAVIKGYFAFESCITTSATIANLADVLQIVQYVRAEQVLGNQTLNGVLTDSLKRIAALREELKPYERPIK